MSAHPHSEETQGRVIAFPRQPDQGRRDGRTAAEALAGNPPAGTAPAEPTLGLESYEQDQTTDDYRHRMAVNAAAGLVIVLLILGGVWLAEAIAKLRKDQDCVLSGRRNCAGISITNPR